MAVAGASRGASRPKEVVRQVAAHPWTGNLTRLGYAARGVLYVTMGLLAAQVALGRGGGTGRRLDQEGAIAGLVAEGDALSLETAAAMRRACGLEEPE